MAIVTDWFASPPKLTDQERLIRALHLIELSQRDDAIQIIQKLTRELAQAPSSEEIRKTGNVRDLFRGIATAHTPEQALAWVRSVDFFWLRPGVRDADATVGATSNLIRVGSGIFGDMFELYSAQRLLAHGLDPSDYVAFGRRFGTDGEADILLSLSGGRLLSGPIYLADGTAASQLPMAAGATVLADAKHTIATSLSVSNVKGDTIKKWANGLVGGTYGQVMIPTNKTPDINLVEFVADGLLGNGAGEHTSDVFFIVLEGTPF